MRKNHRQKSNHGHFRLYVGLFICVAVIVFLYCIACNIVSNLDDLPKSVKIVFGLSDFANTAIGALLGFGASLLLENYLIDNNKEKAIDNIAAEMTQMCLHISKLYSEPMNVDSGKDITLVLSKFSQNNGKYNNETDDKGLKKLKNRVIHCKYTIYLPIWDSVLQNGDLLRFKDKDYFESLINIYTRLNKFKAQIDMFDNSLEGEKLYLSLFELYKDVQKLREAIKNNSEQVQAICQYLKGDANVQLKEEFLSEFDMA